MKKIYILALDIGNTNIVAGLFKGNYLVQKRIIPTKVASFPLLLRKILKAILYRRAIEGVIISSVVPRAQRCVKTALKDIFGARVYILGEDIKATIKNLYKKPRQVGQDRLANGVAIYRRYGGGIALDFGTAVTFDVISKQNEYLGGIIFPGIRLSLENLSHRAALLPKIKLSPIRSLLGKDTSSSMRSGILNGYAVLCDGIIKRLRSKHGKRLLVVATGGDAPLMAKYCRSIDRVVPDLTLEGLYIIYTDQARIK